MEYSDYNYRVSKMRFYNGTLAGISDALFGCGDKNLADTSLNDILLFELEYASSSTLNLYHFKVTQVNAAPDLRCVQIEKVDSLVGTALYLIAS